MLAVVPLDVTNVDIDTDGRLVWTRVHREYFRDHPEMFGFRGPGKIFMSAYADFIAHKNQKLGSAGHDESLRCRRNWQNRAPTGDSMTYLYGKAQWATA